MTVHETVLPAATLAVAVGILALVWRTRRELRDRGDVDADRLSAAIGETWRDMEFERTIDRVERHAAKMREFHGDIERMLRTPRERGEFGERQLDVILGDHLPPDAYGIRERVVDGKTPDAHVDAPAGLIAIDSKFPLDNYERSLEADTDEERERHWRAFRRDVDDQLSKVAADYVRPAEGTAEFAFAFVPSESVYHHLVSEEYDLLAEYTKRGVQVVSPLTFGHKLELIKADVQARQLTEQAEAVRDRLDRLGERFETLEDEWETLSRHVANAESKAEDVDREYDRLRAEFDRIERPAAEE